ncbi:hypothetical protein IP88_03860 [alpha proteobacterium AAP81b]|nr:hypothetical protein IP88_03860 [alpha proteobacterium AAP81b]
MTALGARLAGELSHLALCWRIVRVDGVALGFTTHDRPLEIAGLRHLSAPGMAPSAVVRSAGLEVDTMAIEGALSAAAITAADLAAGRYDGAEVTLTLVDWREPAAGSEVLARGSLGAVASSGGADPGFVATLRGETAALEATAIEIYSPECRAQLGDARCRVALRGLRERRAVAAIDGRTVRLDGLDAAAAALFGAGRLRLLDGGDAGLDRLIVGVDGDGLQLDAVLAAVPGARVEITQGCDKRFATCRDRFANAGNFRGEPHVPGGDLLARFAIA